MEDRSVRRTRQVDVVMDCVIPYIDDPKDRDAVSQVCRRWYELDSMTRKHVTIALCYTTTPDRLRRRFPHLESLKLKGKPRAAMFNLIPEDWGGYVTPWVMEISKHFGCLRSLHFRRMIVKDSDLELLATSRGHVLHSLKLDKCSGFSTDGLFFVARFCRNLRVLFLEESTIVEKDGEWLHELALNNTVLESLNFYLTDIAAVGIQDLELIARNCPNLVSVRVTDSEILDLVNFFRYATSLEEFCGGAYTEEPDRYNAVTLPAKLCRLGLTNIETNELPIVFVYASVLKKLDLMFAMLDTEDHCKLIEKCPNLEVLEIGTHLRNLCDFRLVLLDHEAEITDLPLDEGVKALLMGCNKLRRFALYLRPGGLTDQGLAYIGQYSQNVRWMLLGYVGQSDAGLLEFSKGCPNLQKLEMRGCSFFSERALAVAAMRLASLRYLWVQGYGASSSGRDLLAMARPFWNIELIPSRHVAVNNNPEMPVVIEHPAHILAYYSLAGQRDDFPDSVVPLESTICA
ncbi:Coronatine-insensitive protein [Stylosanthes scabra]|uniref:Coronatine-insensitive protein n=1 Tax=Stylosanthes scabra TaxID=79078 RepID=A0ABU6VK03_9FABA|nr:Coronatine-insensitive protein [Stylosanthes scabra]